MREEVAGLVVNTRHDDALPTIDVQLFPLGAICRPKGHQHWRVRTTRHPFQGFALLQ